MSFMCLLFLLLDPETGEEYMIRRGECVNVLPGILKKVQLLYKFEGCDKFEYKFQNKLIESSVALLHCRRNRTCLCSSPSNIILLL